MFLSKDESRIEKHEKATCYLLGHAQADGGSTDRATVTDLCNDQDLPEIEIVSLIEEQIPRYRLRADSIIDFSGYGNQDWIHTPVLPPIDDADLTPELVEETLKYFILCADRVTQMTKTYNDIEAVSRLLEEKERDLELAARIGQSLLEKNKCLDEKNDELEELISQAYERINQLRHDLMMKDELLQLYLQNYDSIDACLPDTCEKLTVPTLQKKIKTLEEENENLHLETANLKSVTDGWEDKEQKLVSDCVQQLEDLHQQLAQFAKELSEKTEECSQHKDEITNLLHQIVTLQKRIRTLTAENLDLQKTLEASNDSQTYLTREIRDLKEKNEEILLLLQQAQEELRHLRSKEHPHAVHHINMSTSFLSMPGDSLASELETTLRSEIDYPKGCSPENRKKHIWKVFETAKAVYSHHAGSSCNASMLGTSGLETGDSKSVSQRSSMYFSDAESGVGEGFGSDIESQYGALSSRLGKPGVPGSCDLQIALRRLTRRLANEPNDHDSGQDEKARQELESRIGDQIVSDVTDLSDTNSHAIARCHSPDSMFSANSGYISMTGSSGNPYYRMPERLKIVKPLEGSVTLKRWQELATPHIGVIFESSPGVHNKGEKTLDIVQEVYNFSDYEEDDDINVCPTRHPDNAMVYTFTDSTVRHPAEVARVPIMSSMTSTPRMMFSDRFSLSQGTSAYSTSLGLASVLDECDIVQPPPKKATAQVRSMQDSRPLRFPSLVTETKSTADESLSLSVSLPFPTNVYQFIPPISTLPQRSHIGSHSWLQTDPQWPGMQASVGTLGSECDHTSQNSSLGYQGNTAYGSSSGKRPTVGNLDSDGINMISKLKERGVSLFGYITSGVSGYNSGSATLTEVSHPCAAVTFSTPSTSVPCAGTSVSESSIANSVSSIDSVVTTMINTNSVVNASTTQSETPKRLHLASILSRKSASSIMGAFSKLTRDGAF